MDLQRINVATAASRNGHCTRDAVDPTPPAGALVPAPLFGSSGLFWGAFIKLGRSAIERQRLARRQSGCAVG